ncbi:MAG TPA: hypothetical protein VIK07_11355 [Bacteroidales bacterium]
MDQFSSHPLYRRHNIDSAMSSLWEFYKKKFIPLFLISLAMSFILQYASTFINIKEIQSITDPMLMLQKISGYIVPILIISIVNLLFTTILQYYIINNPISSESTIFSSVINSFKYFIPYLIIMVILTFAGSIAIVLGILALVVGVFFSMLYIMTLYLFILPVMMVEDTNIGNTISRTIKLAHRNFWTNMGWVAVIVILLIVVSVIMSGIILLPFTGNFIKTLTNPENAKSVTDMATNPVYLILSAIVGALTVPVLPIFACILYFNARANEEQAQVIIQPGTEDNRVRVEDLYAKPYADDHPENPERKD